MHIICHPSWFVKRFFAFPSQVQRLFTNRQKSHETAFNGLGFMLQWSWVMQMKSSRLFEIVYRLLSSGRCTAPELAQKLEVSVRTIYRDIEALCQAGVPIVTEQGKSGGIRLMEGWSLSQTLMDAREQEQLLTAVQSLAGLQQDAEALALKLGALFRRQPHDWLRVDFHYWGPANQNDERFELIKTALLEKRMLQFTYAAYTGTTRRRVKPALLCFKANAWYLQAFCLVRGDYRTFKLSRVSNLALTEEHFEDHLVPPPLDPWDWSVHWPEARLRFEPYTAYRVYDDFDEEAISPQPDGRLLVTTQLPPDDEWMLGRLLTYGTGVEILSPSSLRKAVADHAQKLLEHYQKENNPDG